MIRDIIKKLWQIIDDIDTIGDIAKSDDKLYRRMVEKKQIERWELPIECDGQTIYYGKTYKQCVFEKFKEGKCVVVAINKITGHIWTIKEHEIEILESMINAKHIDMFPIPIQIADSEVMTIVC